MTNMHDQPSIDTTWTCVDCWAEQVEAITEFHETTDPLVCGRCLCTTQVSELDVGEMENYMLAIKQAGAMV